MLVLSRQRGEVIKIGDDIEVIVCDILGSKVRLGVNAPKDVGVHRKEVFDAIQRENRAAARAPGQPEPPPPIPLRAVPVLGLVNSGEQQQAPPAAGGPAAV